MVSTEVTMRHINDFTDCPLCAEVFTDPRQLPCIHTFCLDCITKWHEDQGKDDMVTCPLCKEKSTIPAGGLAKNVFVERLSKARKLSHAMSANEVPCEVCNTDEGKKTTVYCVECGQNMCDVCSSFHRRMKMSSAHKLVDIQESGLLEVQLLSQLSDAMCDKHAGEMLKLYCCECSRPICVMCHATGHVGHRCADVKQVADDLRNQIKCDADIVVDKVTKCRQTHAELENGIPSLNEKVASTEQTIIETADKMKLLIDEYKVKLLNDLQLMKELQERKLESATVELEGVMQTLETFQEYSDELRSRGSDCEVAMAAGSLHDRAVELTKYDGGPRNELNSFVALTFDSKFTARQLMQLFGELVVENRAAVACSANKVGPVVVSPVEPIRAFHSKNGLGVTGVASLRNELFVICYRSITLEVYDAATLNLQRSLPLESVALKSSLAACSLNNCVYLSTYSGNMIYRIDRPSGKMMNWIAGRTPHGLSLTSSGNVLVMCCELSKVQEFTPRGILVREILLQSGSETFYALQAVELADGHIGVTHAGSQHRFCVFDEAGRIVRSFGGPRGYGPRRLNIPFGLTRFSDHNIVFIADDYNNRVVMLDHSTMTTIPLHLDVPEAKLKHPYCVHYDSTYRRLYIGEGSGNCSDNRVVVVPIIEPGQD